MICNLEYYVFISLNSNKYKLVLIIFYNYFLNIDQRMHKLNYIEIG